MHIARSSSASTPRAEPAWLTAAAGMLALASALGIGRFVYTPILPAMAGALGLSASGAGLIGSANFAGYLLGGIVAAAPRLPGGRRAWFVGGLLVGAVATVEMGLVEGLPAYLALRFAGGASSAFVLVLGTSAVLDQLAAAGRPGLRPVHYAGVGLGIVLSAVVVALLEASGADWRTLWVGAGVIASVMLVLPVAVLRWRESGAAGRGGAGKLGPGVLPLALCHGLFGLGYVVTATFLVALVRESAGGRGLGALVWIVVGLAAVPSSFLWDRVAGWLGARRGYALAAVLEAVGVLVAGGWPTQAGLMIAAMLFGGTFMGLTALGFAVARGFGVERQERRFAVITVGFGLGQVVGPVLGGAMSDWTGGFWAPSVLAASALLLAAALVLAGGRGSQT